MSAAFVELEVTQCASRWLPSGLGNRREEVRVDVLEAVVASDKCDEARVVGRGTAHDDDDNDENAVMLLCW